MSEFLLADTATAQWLKLVEEAERACERALDEEVESYLVFVLQRFLGSRELAGAVLGLDYLEGQHLLGQARTGALRDVGDRCLLVSGLFPGRAERRRVSVFYYVELGRAAYRQIAEEGARGFGDLFQHLSEEFIPMMDVLQTMKSMGEAEPLLDPLHDAELWNTTGSHAAKRRLSEITEGFFMPGDEDQRH